MTPAQMMFRQLLIEANQHELFRFGSINHHANGMDYLCLQRNDRVTLKLYLIREPVNNNGGFLINPHSHRYSFMSSVLAGSLQHILFREGPTVKGKQWRKSTYYADRPEGQRAVPDGVVGLDVISRRKYVPADGMDSYFVGPEEIHTLQIIGEGVTMIGLIQHADVSDRSELYVPKGGSFLVPDTRMPTLREAKNMRDECISYLNVKG